MADLSQLANYLPALITAVSSAVLAIVTYVYLNETKLIREATHHPSFVLAPTLYTIGGQFHRLLLVNNGQVASDIRVDCSWGGSTKEFYILSLGNQGRANLDIPIADIVSSGHELSVAIGCLDARGEEYKTQLRIPFDELKTENRATIYQYDPNESLLDALEKIEHKLER